MKQKIILTILALLCLGGCGFGNTSDPARFYALSTPEVQQVRGPAKSTNIVIENVSIPQSVDRPQIVIKKPDSNMLVVSEFDRWIEGLANALPVVISENINMYVKNINARPGRNTAISEHAKYIVSIDFVRFETEADAQTTISAWWTLANNHGDILAQKKTTQAMNTPGSTSAGYDYDAIVATYSKLIAKLSYKIADVITELK
jgi:hypothetical protein